MFLRATIRSTLLAAALLLQAAGVEAGSKPPVYTYDELAVSGYDPVAYFEEGRPVEGRSDLEHRWNGATWRFASEASLEAFKADPEAYAPQYGGYCAWAVSQGYTASSVPEAWRIVDGKLYLNYSTGVQRQWEEDIPANVAKADRNWPKVLE